MSKETAEISEGLQRKLTAAGVLKLTDLQSGEVRARFATILLAPHEAEELITLLHDVGVTAWVLPVAGSPLAVDVQQLGAMLVEAMGGLTLVMQQLTAMAEVMWGGGRPLQQPPKEE